MGCSTHADTSRGIGRRAKAELGGSRASVGLGGLPRAGDTDAVPQTEQNLPKERGEGMQAVRVAHLIEIITAECVCYFLVACTMSKSTNFYYC